MRYIITRDPTNYGITEILTKACSKFETRMIGSLLSQHASPKLCTLVQGFSCYTGILSSNS